MSARWAGQDTVISVAGVLAAIGIGWAAGALVDSPDWLSTTIDVVVTLGLCAVLGFWLRSRTIARGVAAEDAARLR